MNRLAMYSVLLMVVLSACKSSKTAMGDLVVEDAVAVSPSVFVMDIATEYEFLDSTRSDTSVLGLAGILLDPFAQSVIIHDDHRVSKVGFDEEGQVVIHTVYDQDSKELKMYSQSPDGDASYSEFMVDTVFNKDMVPAMMQRIKDTGALSIDSASHVAILGYDCIKARFAPTSDGSIEYFFSEQMPGFEGVLGVVLNTMFDLALQNVTENYTEGIRIIKAPRNRRVDNTMEKYLEMNADTYSDKLGTDTR